MMPLKATNIRRIYYYYNYSSFKQFFPQLLLLKLLIKLLLLKILTLPTFIIKMIIKIAYFYWKL